MEQDARCLPVCAKCGQEVDTSLALLILQTKGTNALQILFANQHCDLIMLTANLIENADLENQGIGVCRKRQDDVGSSQLPSQSGA